MQGRAPGARRAGDPLPARRGLPRRAAGGAARPPTSTTTRSWSSRPTSSARRSRRTPGIIGEGVDLNLEHLGDVRPSHAALPPHAAPALHEVARPRRGAEAPPLRPAQAHRQAVARHLPRLQGRHVPGAAHVPGAGRHGLRPDHRRHHARVRRRAADQGGARSLQPDRLDGARPLQHVARPTAGRPSPQRCHVNWVVLDSDWEAEFCRVAEAHPRVRAYVKNHNLGLRGAVPLRLGDAQVPARLHRAGRRRARRRRPAAPGRRDQGLPRARTRRRRRRRWRPTGCRA